MNNAGQTPKNIRITQVGEEVKRIGGEMTNYNQGVCGEHCEMEKVE